MKLLDANVFIYALGGSHEYREPCQSVLALVRSGQIEATTDTSVLQEILHVSRHRGRVEHGRRTVIDVAGTIPGMLPVLTGTMLRAADILVEYPHLQSHDAVHAAVVLEHNLDGIISADRAFDMIDGLTRFDPKELAA